MIVLIKKHIFNIIGILLSLFISFGVWAAVVILIEKNENDILKGKSEILFFPLNSGAVNVLEQNEPYFSGIYYDKEKLTRRDIADAVISRAENEFQIHTAGINQMSIEEALDTANNFITFLISNGIIDYINESYDYSLALYGLSGVAITKDTAKYSFWETSFTNSFYSFVLHINAVSGDVLYSEITSNDESGIEFNEFAPEELLAVYDIYLGFPAVGTVYIENRRAYRTFDSLFVSHAEVSDSKIILQLLPY